jgi:hypothetical protein
LEKTDEYLNKYMEFKVQKMIDDTLFSIMPNVEFQKLINYEERQFKIFMTNLKTKESKLLKDEYEVPTAEERQKLIKAKGIERLKTEGNTLAAEKTIMGLFISPASTPEKNPSALRVNALRRMQMKEGNSSMGLGGNLAVPGGGLNKKNSSTMQLPSGIIVESASTTSNVNRQSSL